MNIGFRQALLPGGRLVLRVSGDIDVYTAGRLEQKLREAFATPYVQVVELDLRDTGYIDSTGLGKLIAAHKGDYGSAGQRFEVTNVSQIMPKIYRILCLTGLIHIFHFTEPKELPA